MEYRLDPEIETAFRATVIHRDGRLLWVYNGREFAIDAMSAGLKARDLNDALRGYAVWHEQNAKPIE